MDKKGKSSADSTKQFMKYPEDTNFNVSPDLSQQPVQQTNGTSVKGEVRKILYSPN